MLGFSRNPYTQELIMPYHLAHIVGGTWRQSNGGYGWTPNLYRRARKYFREGWNEKYTWREFCFGRKGDSR